MSGNRTSIFEAFSMPHTSLSTQSTSRPSNIIRYSAEDEGSSTINIDENDDDYENSAFNDVEEIENCGDDNGTLWMSCSPGRDSGEEEESCNSSIIYEPMNVMDFQPTEKYIPIEMVEEVEESSPLKLKFKVKDSKARDHINNDDNFNKPLSSYALFFRDTQIAIKDQNPDISFGEVSRVVATMWDNLDANHKQYYNKLAEEAKLTEKSPKKEKLIHTHHHREKVPSKKSPKDKHQANERSDKPAFAKRQTKTISYKCFADKVTTKCTREGCSNKAIDDPRWSKEYCSTLCVVSHCKDVYKAWVALRKSSTTKTKT